MNWDSRLDAFGVKLTSTPNARWALASGIYQDEVQSGGNHIIHFTVQDEQAMPCPNVPCIVDWVGRDPGDVPTRVVTDEQGTANVPIYANLDIHRLDGPYFAYVEKQDSSDVVTGMGLPEHHHVNFMLTFASQPAAPSISSPSSPALEQAALAAARSVPWMPVNSQSALWSFARANGLQDQQTGEVKFIYNGENYIAQVFNLGIVYAKEGDWENIQLIRK